MNSHRVGGRSLWEIAEQVIRHLASWSHRGPGCRSDGRNCDRFELGLHFWSTVKRRAIAVREDVKDQHIRRAFGRAGGGTLFHLASELIEGERALREDEGGGFAVLVTDGHPANAFTARAAIRTLCDVRERDGAPVRTYALGFGGASKDELNSMLAAAGGTGRCCLREDGRRCDPDSEAHRLDPCEMVEYERRERDRLVAEFEAMLGPAQRDQWGRVFTYLDRHNSMTRGALTHKIDVAYDMAMFWRWHLGQDPDRRDWLRQMRRTLSHVVRHQYTHSWYSRGGYAARAERLPSSRWYYLRTERDSSGDVTGGIRCTGGIAAHTGPELRRHLLEVFDENECRYELALPAGMQGAPAEPDSVEVSLRFTDIGADLEIPHIGDTAGRSSMVDRLRNWGIQGHGRYRHEGWRFADAQRTEIQLSDRLCGLLGAAQGGAVSAVTTRVCGGCRDEGEPCTVSCDEGDPHCFGGQRVGRCARGVVRCVRGASVCMPVRSPMPEICNGLDDDCDGRVDDLSANATEWSEPEYDLSTVYEGEYEGAYCNYENSCVCDAVAAGHGGSAAADDEFEAMLAHRRRTSSCVCVAGLSPSSESGSSAQHQREPVAPDAADGEPACAMGSSGMRRGPAHDRGVPFAALGILFSLLWCGRSSRADSPVTSRTIDN
jgi:hypothetical protein